MILRKQQPTKIVLGALNILLAVPLFIYTAASIFTRLSADDYCVAAVAREDGLFGSIQWWYVTFNGRFMSYLTMGAATLGGQPLTVLLTFLFVVVWWLSLLGIFRILLIQAVRNIDYAGLQAGIIASILVLATLDAVPSIWTALYWYGGTFMYTASIAIFCLYIWLMLQQRLRPELLVVLLGGVIAFAVSGYSDIGGLCLIVCLTAGGIFGLVSLRRRPDAERLKRLVIRCAVGWLGAVIGLAIVVAAPGSSVRIRVHAQPSISQAISGTLSGLGAPTFVAFHFSPLTTLCVFLIPAIIAYSSPFSLSLRQRRQAMIAMIVIIVSMWVLFAACFAPAFYFLPGGLDEHAWVTPIFIFIAGFLLLGYAAGLAFKGRRLMASTVPAMGIAACIAIVVIGSIVQSINVTDTLQKYAAGWDGRDVAARTDVSQGLGTPANGPLTDFYDPATNVSGNVRPLVIASLASYSPYRWEVEDDMNMFANKCAARYYNVAALIAK